MDPSVSESLLERGRQRDKILPGGSSPKSNLISKTKISTLVPGSPKGQMRRHNVLNFQQDHFDMEIKLASMDKCLVQVEIQEQGDESAESVREESKCRLRRLGKLYCSGEDVEMSSPIHHRTEEMVPENMLGNDRSQLSHKGRSKLAALAENINLWENESPLPLPSKRIVTNNKPPQPLSSVIHKRNKEKTAMELNDSIVNVLECQGYTRDASKLLTYHFESGVAEEKENRDRVTCKRFIPPPTACLIDEEKRTPRGRPSIHIPTYKDNRDPSALSLNERKAIFERNADKGAAPLLPKTTPNVAVTDGNSNSRNKNVPPTKEKQSSNVIGDGIASNRLFGTLQKGCESAKLEQQQDMNRRFHKAAIVSSENGNANVETKQHVAAGSTQCKIQKRHRHNNSGCSAQVQSVLESVREVRVRRSDNNDSRQHRLYPVLSDLETETETTESPDQYDNYDNADVTTTTDDSSLLELSLSASVSSVERDDSGGDSCCSGPTPPKCGKVLFKSPIAYHQYYEGTQPTHVMDGDEVVPLQHTVSFYRKHQQEQCNVAVAHKPQQQQQQVQSMLDSIVDDDDDDDDWKQVLLDKIGLLHVEVQKQERTVAQASQALNLCNVRLEFNGSIEQVEAERLLLIAAHRRQAALYEISKLQVALMTTIGGPIGGNQVTGTLLIGQVTLPLKREYVRALGAAGGNGHHVVCLIKCEDAKQQVFATKVVSTTANSEKTSIDAANTVELHDIRPQSSVTVEVYCLQAHDQHLPHHIKYHIKQHATTPRKLQLLMRKDINTAAAATGNKMIEESAISHSTSSFALMGYVIFTVRSLMDGSRTLKQHTHTDHHQTPPFTLNQTPQMSPLEGSVHLGQLRCTWKMPTVERRGFLTMFEEVNGFGAWHRRWFRLDGNGALLHYWRYPDDELERPGKLIELRGCKEGGVGLVPRDVCARLHTILLERWKDAGADPPTTHRYLLSADTKEERIIWCKDINLVIAALTATATTI